MAYGAKCKDHFNHPRNVGRIVSPDAEGREGEPGRGNYMVLTLKLNGDRIADIRFQTYGCPGAIACGSAVTELARGKTLAEARGIDAKAVEDHLGGLPLGKGHCAKLAAGALRKALDAVSGVPR